MESHFLETNFSFCHLLVCIMIDIFDSLRCFIDILHKYKFYDEKECKVNLSNKISVGWNIFQEPLRRKLIITDQTFPLEKNLNSITAEASDIEDTILFNDHPYDKMKYHWIDYPHALSIRQNDSLFLHSKLLIMSSNERFIQKNIQSGKFQVLYFI